MEMIKTMRAPVLALVVLLAAISATVPITQGSATNAANIVETASTTTGNKTTGDPILEDMVTFLVQVPYGIEDGGLAVQGNNLSAYVFMESFLHGEMDVVIRLDFPDGFQIRGPALQSFKLYTEYDDWYQFIDFYVPPDMPTGTYAIKATATIEIEGQQDVIERNIAIRVASKDEVSDMISINRVIIPSDEEGIGDASRQENTFVLQETSPLIKRMAVIAGIGSSDGDGDVKVSHIGVEIENNGDEAIPLIISYAILDVNTRQPVEEFRPTLMGMSSETFSYANIILPAGSKKTVGLPVYISETALGGEYLMHVKATVMGSDWTAAARDDRINAISRNWTSIFISLSALLLTITAIGIFVLRSNAIISSFKTRHLMMISLFGTASFAAVNIPMTFLWDIAHAVLGPFSFLFIGIFYEIVLYMLIVASVVLIPKPGVVTLLLMVRYLLNGVLLGHFNPVFLISYSVNAIALEFMLYAVGMTRGNVIGGYAGRIRTGFVCATADALSQYVSFNVWMVLYRLFYSDWYIRANILIDGFLYTFIGAWLGINLGNRLKKVIE